MAKKSANEGSYSAKDITVLEGLEAVRKRPGMYIGTTGVEGVFHLVREIFDNSRDEAMAGYADRVEIALLPGGEVRVVDNGRGIPVDKHPKTKVSALETILTTLHAGGKFGDAGYKVSGGLHGVGSSVVNALSVTMSAHVHLGGAIHNQNYERGKKTGEVKKVGTTTETGTIIRYNPDSEIFPEITYSWQKLVNHMRQQAYLVRGMRVVLLDMRDLDTKINYDKEFWLEDLELDVPSTSFYFEGGLRSFVSFYNHHLKPVHGTIFYLDKPADESTNDVEVEVALQYVDDMATRLFPFANTIYNSEGGMHVTGFKTALTRTLNKYAQDNNLVKDKDGTFSGDDVLEGLTAVVSVKMAEIQFEGQTKAKLGSTEARGAVEGAFGEAFSTYLEENPNDAKAIINKVVLALRARKAAKAAKDSIMRKGALEGMTLPGKLADCQTRKAEEAEIFIVEGDSAGGTAKGGRDRRTQAILPVFGKILNVERVRLDRLISSDKLKDLILALGTGIGDTFEIEKLRYHKIIIATDADVDGAHIRTLQLTLFYRYLRQIVEGGYLYIAQPPLYKLPLGKELQYFYTEAEKDEWLKANAISAEETDGSTSAVVIKHPTTGKETKVILQRYKGLGEMNAEELKETTMDPEKRVLKQVTVEDAQEADRIFDVLMGTDVSARKSFITSNARLATLDI